MILGTEQKFNRANLKDTSINQKGNCSIENFKEYKINSNNKKNKKNTICKKP